jgi:hypothetical protein
MMMNVPAASMYVPRDLPIGGGPSESMMGATTACFVQAVACLPGCPPLLWLKRLLPQLKLLQVHCNGNHYSLQ